MKAKNKPQKLVAKRDVYTEYSERYDRQTLKRLYKKWKTKGLFGVEYHLFMRLLDKEMKKL